VTAIAVALAFLGGAFELAGLALVVVGIRRDREEARRLFVPRPREEWPTRTYPPKASPRSYPGIGGPVTVGNPLREIAEYVSKVDAAAYNNFIEFQEAFDADLKGAADRLREEAADADDELRKSLLYVLAGSIDDRVKGAILLAVGIVLAAAGSVVGTLSG
jgi:hypothetical protein